MNEDHLTPADRWQVKENDDDDEEEEEEEEEEELCKTQTFDFQSSTFSTHEHWAIPTIHSCTEESSNSVRCIPVGAPIQYDIDTH
ncbi:hypothetical protein BOTCAL_0980g00020 [Botryotinia calthae]|uniref:Uncharacterized protein n=1 Tax=Botryotinia calthae TaxID=38488 RepID=A0A4Y8CEE7_9HELO|nr:hypothetical protein BOTCAL_0980g00020 [Botryotinia calthae]